MSSRDFAPNLARGCRFGAIYRPSRRGTGRQIRSRPREQPNARPRSDRLNRPMVTAPGAARPRGLLAVEVSGAGEPLVLIHGLATTARIWSAVTPALVQSRRVVTLDLPGFGASAPAGPGFELPRVAERIARGVAARGVHAPFDLVGHSLGAAVALTLASARPRLVRRLVLVAPAGLMPVPWPASVLLPAVAPGLHAARRAVAPLAGWPWGRRLLLGFTAADGG